jgi:hypothetical protein
MEYFLTSTTQIRITRSTGCTLLTVRARVNRIHLIFGYQVGLTRYQDPLIAVSQGLTAAVVILSAVSGLAGEDHLRVLGALCGTIVRLYVGMAVMVRRWLASLPQLGVAPVSYVLAL